MSKETELKPCPLCGSKADILESHIGARVSCSRCDVGLIHGDWTEKKAVEIWNARHEIDTLTQQRDKAVELLEHSVNRLDKDLGFTGEGNAVRLFLSELKDANNASKTQ